MALVSSHTRVHTYIDILCRVRITIQSFTCTCILCIAHCASLMFSHVVVVCGMVVGSDESAAPISAAHALLGSRGLPGRNDPLCALTWALGTRRDPHFGLVVACPPQISFRRVLGSSLLGLGSPRPSPDGWPLVPPLDPAPSGPASGPPCGGSPRVEVSCFCFCLAAPFYLLAGQTRYLARARELRVLQTLNK